MSVLVGSDCKISMRDNQLFLLNVSTGEKIDYSLEDLDALVIESLQTTITTKSLLKLAENNVAVYFCDEHHLPSVQLLGYNGFYKNLKIYTIQTSCPKPIQKRLWQKIVCKKIENQAKVLQYRNIENDLHLLSDKVLSGDTSNVEGVAAQKYFRLLFGKYFARNQLSMVNSALDYGYSIIRGAIARSLVSHGLLSYIGIHHCNQLNAFNLADDLIEVFRPVVDLYVSNKVIDITGFDLSTSLKQNLVGLLNANVIVDNKKYPVSYAIELLVTSLISSMSKKAVCLSLPNIIPLEMHRYE